MSTPIKDSNQSIPQSACQDLALNLQAFDFDHFFKIFGIDSPISQFLESFSISSLEHLMARAFTTLTPSDTGSPNYRYVIKARYELEDNLQNIDAAFKIIAAAKLDVQAVRSSLNWVRTVNQRMLEEEFAFPGSDRAPLHSSTAAGGTSNNYRPPTPIGPRSTNTDSHSLPAGFSRQIPSSLSSSRHHGSGPLPYWERYPRSPGYRSSSGDHSRQSIPGTNLSSSDPVQNSRDDLSMQSEAIGYQQSQH